MTATAAGTTRARPPRKLKRPIRCNAGSAVLFLIAGVVGVVALIMAASLVYISQTAYQAGHQPSPVGAAQGFLYATLQEQDKTAAHQYLCSDAAIQRRVDTLIDGELRYLDTHPGDAITYNWSSVQEISHHGDTATVATDVGGRIVHNGQRLRASPQHWTLGMRNRSGWKVCSLSITGG